MVFKRDVQGCPKMGRTLGSLTGSRVSRDCIHMAMGQNLWLHFGVDEHPFAPYLMFTRGLLGFDPYGAPPINYLWCPFPSTAREPGFTKRGTRQPGPPAGPLRSGVPGQIRPRGAPAEKKGAPKMIHVLKARGLMKVSKGQSPCHK